MFKQLGWATLTDRRRGIRRLTHTNSSACLVNLLEWALSLAISAALLFMLSAFADPEALAQSAPRSQKDLNFARTVDGHFQARASQGFSGVLLVAAGDEVLLEKAYGYRDPSTRAPMSTSNVFDIGSLVKPITRAAILKLEAEGKLNTYDPIVKFFPDLPDDKRAIRIDHVISHVAGFPDTFGGDYDLIRKDQLREKLFEASLIAPVGAEFNYSNAGYSLLAMLIERVSGSPYEEYVNEALFIPAGTERIGYTIPSWPVATVAVGIGQNSEYFGTPLEHPWFGDGPGWNLRGNGGMLANVRDLYVLFMALEGNSKVLPVSARAKLFPPRPAQDGGVTYFSAGGNGVFNSVIIRNITNNTTVVALSNIGDNQIEQGQTLNIIDEALEAHAETTRK